MSEKLQALSNKVWCRCVEKWVAPERCDNHNWMPPHERDATPACRQSLESHHAIHALQPALCGVHPQSNPYLPAGL